MSRSCTDFPLICRALLTYPNVLTPHRCDSMWRSYVRDALDLALEDRERVGRADRRLAEQAVDGDYRLITGYLSPQPRVYNLHMRR